MAYIVYRTDKKTGTIYAYRQEAYRDPQTKKPRNHRTYLGRVDPISKMIIPKGENGKHNTTKVGEIKAEDRVLPPDALEIIAKQNAELEQLKVMIREKDAQMRTLIRTVKQMNTLTGKLLDAVG